MPEPTLRLSLPEAGVTDGAVVLRLPVADDLDGLMPAFTDPELRAAGNLPDFSREEMVATLPHLPALAASGRLMPDDRARRADRRGRRRRRPAPPRRRARDRRDRLLGPAARAAAGPGHADRQAARRARLELGVRRVAAYVNLDNPTSERVLARRRFTREGVVRSLPRPGGVVRVDKTLFSLLPGE